MPSGAPHRPADSVPRGRPEAAARKAGNGAEAARGPRRQEVRGGGKGRRERPGGGEGRPEAVAKKAGNGPGGGRSASSHLFQPSRNASPAHPAAQLHSCKRTAPHFLPGRGFPPARPSAPFHPVQPGRSASSHLFHPGRNAPPARPAALFHSCQHLFHPVHSARSTSRHIPSAEVHRPHVSPPPSIPANPAGAPRPHIPRPHSSPANARHPLSSHPERLAPTPEAPQEGPGRPLRDPRRGNSFAAGGGNPGKSL